MNAESTENTPLIKAIEEKLVSIDDELSVISAVEAAEGTSRKRNLVLWRYSFRKF